MNPAVPLTEEKDLESKSPITSIEAEDSPLAEGVKAKADTTIKSMNAKDMLRLLLLFIC